MPRLRQAAAGTQQGEFGGKIGQQFFDFGTNHCGLFRVVPLFAVAFRLFQLPLQPGQLFTEYIEWNGDVFRYGAVAVERPERFAKLPGPVDQLRDGFELLPVQVDAGSRDTGHIGAVHREVDGVIAFGDPVERQ